jgi:hypothetical protein
LPFSNKTFNTHNINICHSQTKPLRKQVKKKEKNPKRTHFQKQIAQLKMDGQGTSKYLIDNYLHVVFF